MSVVVVVVSVSFDVGCWLLFVRCLVLLLLSLLVVAVVVVFVVVIVRIKKRYFVHYRVVLVFTLYNLTYRP